MTTRKSRLMKSSATGVTGALPFTDEKKMIGAAVMGFNKALWAQMVDRKKARAEQPAAMPVSVGNAHKT